MFTLLDEIILVLTGTEEKVSDKIRWICGASGLVSLGYAVFSLIRGTDFTMYLLAFLWAAFFFFLVFRDQVREKGGRKTTKVIHWLIILLVFGANIVRFISLI